MPSLLVTGAAGFIGSALVRLLRAETDYRVVSVDKLTYAGNLESLGRALADPHHRFVRADIADAYALRTVFEEERPAAVVHLAAESHVDRSIDAPHDFIDTNIVGTFTLLQESLRHWRTLSDAAAAAFRFVHVSTDEVFGSLGATGKFSEDSPYAPRSPYAATKAAADHLVRAYHHTYGLPTIVTNCSNNYGPCQYPEKLIPLSIHRAVRGESIPVYGTGDNIRDWLYVEDHARALLAVAQRGVPGESYNVGAGAERRNLDIVRALCALLDELAPDPAIPDRTALITFVEDRPGHDLRYAIDMSRIQRELGWRARESLDTGLRKTVAWYLANRRWNDRVLAGHYDGERLGLRQTV